MRPIPTSFHLGPLEVHTYGVGLAITFWFAYRYFEKRLEKRGFPTEWVASMFIWVIVAAIAGARIMHVASNWSFYSSHPADILAIWHGGLSSFGGLILAVPVALFVAHKRCPELGILQGLDIVAPVLLAAWALGRILGPQLMVAGGGHQTHQWFGMYYDGQVGPRVPVPLIQAIEDFLTYLILIFIERKVDARRADSPPGTIPYGTVVGTAMIIWGFTRGLDEHLLLGQDGALGSMLVQLASVGLIIGGALILLHVRRRCGHSPAGDPAAPLSTR